MHLHTTTTRSRETRSVIENIIACVRRWGLKWHFKHTTPNMKGDTTASASLAVVSLFKLNDVMQHKLLRQHASIHMV